MTDLYWVGGTASWDGTAGTKWALTSGGAGGQPIPTTSDNVYLDTLSGAVTVTISASASCLNLDCSGLAGLANFTGTLAGSSSLNIAGSLTLVAGMTRSYTGAITFSSTATGKTITCGSKTLASAISFTGTGGGWTLQDALTTTGNITITRGTFNTNAKALSCASFLSNNSNTRTITLTNSTVACSGTWTINSSGLTFTAIGTAAITYTGSQDFTTGGLTYYAVTLAVVNNMAVIGAMNCTNLTIQPPTKATDVTLDTNSTITGTLTLLGVNAIDARLFVGSATLNTSITLTCAGVSITNTDLRDITGAGAATWTGTSMGNCGGNSGITFPSPVNRYWVHPATASVAINTSNWATSSGGTPGSNWPLAQDTGVFDSNSFGATGKTVTIPASNNSPIRLSNLDWSSAANSPTFTIGLACEVYGSITLRSAMTLTGNSSNAITISGSAATTITSAGKSFGNPITVTNNNGSLTLSDDFVCTQAFTMNGTYNLNGYNHTSTTIISTGNTRVLTLGAGTLTLTGTGTVWQMTGAGLTLNYNTSTIKLTNSSSSTKTFAGNGLTYNNIWNATGNTGVCNITGSNTFNDFKIDAGRTQQFTAATTTTLTTLTALGTSGSGIVIGSITAANHNLVKAGGGTLTVSWCTISRSQASPGSTFFATNSIDGGNNSGWSITAPPPLNLATINGIAIANIKTWNGIPIASLKTFNGIV